VVPVSDADRCDAFELSQSRQPADGPRAADFDGEGYDPLFWQLPQWSLIDFVGMILPACAAALGGLDARLAFAPRRLALNLNTAH
jgi:hypothetical protein